MNIRVEKDGVVVPTRLTRACGIEIADGATDFRIEHNHFVGDVDGWRIALGTGGAVENCVIMSHATYDSLTRPWYKKAIDWARRVA